MVGTAQTRLCPPYEFLPEAAFILEKQCHCERSEAIQKLQRSELDCFVAYAPRDDGSFRPGDRRLV